MKKIAILIAMFVVVGILTGCGHNVLTYSDGIGVDASINPETYTLGLNFRYGKILSVAMKEKTQLQLKAGMTQTSGTSSGNSTGGTVKTGLDTELNFVTGDQITGYTVDLEKVKQQYKTSEAEK
jgi:hypothetical protein